MDDVTTLLYNYIRYQLYKVPTGEKVKGSNSTC